MSNFELGTCRITPSARALLATHGEAPVPLLARHAALERGALSNDGVVLRLRAIAEGKRVYSLFALASGVYVHVVTEADRSHTMICTKEDLDGLKPKAQPSASADLALSDPDTAPGQPTEPGAITDRGSHAREVMAG